MDPKTAAAKASYPGRSMFDPSANIQSAATNSPQKKKSKFKSLFIFKKPLLSKLSQNRKKVIIGAALLVIVGSGIGYEMYQYELSLNPAVIYARKLKTLTQQVSQHVSLPTNEQPITATVSDVTKLPKEAFFQDAQNGDKILLYKKDKKAILYRPSTDQVIAVSVLDFRDVTPTPILMQPVVAGASTSAQSLPSPSVSSAAAPTPQGKILVAPHQ